MSEGRYSDKGSLETAFATDIHMSSQSVNLPRAVDIPGGIVYHPVAESGRVLTYMGLDDYDTLFEARHGRGALDHAPRKSEEIITPFMGITPTTVSTGLVVPYMDKGKSAVGIEPLSQNDCVYMMTYPLNKRVVSPSSEITGEGAVIFTNMTETMLTALD